MAMEAGFELTRNGTLQKSWDFNKNGARSFDVNWD